MNSTHRQLNTIEKNHLGHFAYFPKKLGFDVFEMNGVTIIHCGLKTSMFNITYGSPKDVTSALDHINKIYKGEPFAWWIPPSAHNPLTTKTLIKNGFIIETLEHAMICDLSTIDHFKQKTD